jgi:hypothetical protein
VKPPALILNACMPMASIYPIEAQQYGLQGIAAAALVATTAASFITISAVIWLMRLVSFPGLPAWRAFGSRAGKPRMRHPVRRRFDGLAHGKRPATY